MYLILLLQIPIGARFVGIPRTESTENPYGMMIEIFWEQDDSGALCISHHSQEMPIPSHIQLRASSTAPSRNFSGRPRQVDGIVLDPAQILDTNA